MLLSDNEHLTIILSAIRDYHPGENDIAILIVEKVSQQIIDLVDESFDTQDIYNEVEECFVEDLDQKEVQILANYMKCEWLNRTIMTWENVKPLYEERDFSQANLLKSFKEMLEKEEKKTHRLESIYYRSRDNKPFDFTKLATHP